MNQYPRIEAASENSLILYLGAQTGPQTAQRIASLLPLLQNSFAGHLIDLTPSYHSILIQYDCYALDHFQAMAILNAVLAMPESTTKLAGKAVELPVYYSEQSGPDLAKLAKQAGLSVQDVIRLHQDAEYRVYAIGFAPGFAYLGEVDKRIAAPRLATPRKRVPKGAVAIADRQTAVYPAASPGGWNLIGLCPIPMFNPTQPPYMPVEVGDRVRFRAVDKHEYIALGGDIALLTGECN